MAKTKVTTGRGLMEAFNPTELRAMKNIVAISYGNGAYEVAKLADDYPNAKNGGIIASREWKRVLDAMYVAQENASAKKNKLSALGQGGFTWEELVTPLWTKIHKVKEYYVPCGLVPGYALASKRNLAYFVLAMDEYCREAS